jgi:surface antigen
LDMKTKIIACSLVASCLLSGCDNPKQAIGALAGAGVGGLAGSAIGSGSGRVVAAAVGAGLGALAGGYVGSKLDEADKRQAGATCLQALENGRSGQPAVWKNPDSGNSGTIIPQKAYQTSNGQYCREFQQTIVVGGRAQQGYGTACRQPDGTWEIQGN